jgi:hypothetical protein
VSNSNQNDDSQLDPSNDLPETTPDVAVGPPTGAGTAPSDPAKSHPERKRGGPSYHKPGCGCRPCAARARQAQAVALGSRPEASQALVPAADVLSDLPRADSPRTKANVALWLKMQAADPKCTVKDVADHIGIAPRTLQNQIYKARKEGWLKFEDPLSEVKYGMIPKIAENLNLFLDARDKQVTIEAAKATIWRQFAHEEGIQDAPSTVLALKIELPAGYTGGDLPKPKGIIVGKPNFVDAEVISAESDD